MLLCAVASLAAPQSANSPASNATSLMDTSCIRDLAMCRSVLASCAHPSGHAGRRLAEGSGAGKRGRGARRPLPTNGYVFRESFDDRPAHAIYAAIAAVAFAQRITPRSEVRALLDHVSGALYKAKALAESGGKRKGSSKASKSGKGSSQDDGEDDGAAEDEVTSATAAAAAEKADELLNKIKTEAEKDLSASTTQQQTNEMSVERAKFFAKMNRTLAGTPPTGTPPAGTPPVGTQSAGTPPAGGPLAGTP